MAIVVTGIFIIYQLDSTKPINKSSLMQSNSAVNKTSVEIYKPKLLQDLPATVIRVGSEGNITTHTGVMAVTVIQRINLSSPSDNVSISEISPVWDTRKILYGSWTGVYDENNKQISVPATVTMEETLLSALVTCHQESEKIFANAPIMIPLVNKTMGIVFVKYDLPAIKSDNGTWNLKFAYDSSLKIELPKNAIIVSNNTKICSFNGEPLKKTTIYDLTLQ